MRPLLSSVFGFQVVSLAHGRPTQAPLQHEMSSTGIRILPALNDAIASILKDNTIPGYSLAIVRPRAEVEVEYGAWGIRTEDGDEMTPEVYLYTVFYIMTAH
jgi:hypothetical protein